MGETFLLTLKMLVNYTGAVVIVDSHPIQRVRHMEWNLNEVILEEHNIFRKIFVQIVINF